MEKAKTALPPKHNAIVFDFSEERSRRKKKPVKDEYKPDFSNFNKYLERSKRDDEK